MITILMNNLLNNVIKNCYPIFNLNKNRDITIELSLIYFKFFNMYKINKLHLIILNMYNFKNPSYFSVFFFYILFKLNLYNSNIFTVIWII